MANYAIRSRDSILPVACAFLLLIACISCGGKGSPTAPGSTDQAGAMLTSPSESNARIPAGVANHTPWGVYTIVIDQDAKTIEVLDNRELAKHWNVKGLLQNPFWCPAKNCISIQFLNIDEVNNIYTIKGTLVNPTYFNGYDVRAIIFLDQKGHKLLNADDYTMLYETETDINPFRAYAKTVDKRQFKSYASFSEIFEMYVPPVPKKLMIDFAIDASFPTNCVEPYDLDAFGFEGKIYPDDPDLPEIDQGEGLVFTKVYDWQSNVSEVTVDTTPITGDITPLEYNPLTDRWEATITDALDAIPGDYVCLMAAFSSDDSTIGLYNYITVHVDETPPPAVQTIWGHVGDAFFLNDLDGAIVSVVNDDPLSYSPEPTTVVDGQYLVNVVMGAYTISVVADDAVHLSQVASDVAVTTKEDVHVNFGLQDPTQIDPYGSLYLSWAMVMGFAGRLVDGGTGMPVSGATVEFTAPDLGGINGQDFVQAEISDEGGYFSTTNLPTSPDGYTMITQYRVKARAEGYEETDAGLFPTMANTVPYSVISLNPISETPVWTEDFESDTGWTFTGYYHRQLWSPSILNVSFDPTYNMCVVPPDELWGGGLPKPPGGDYYVWYGVEADGNFLGEWDHSGQTQWGGGTSLFTHSGTADSPPIDLVGYTSGRVEFDMSYDQESQDAPGYELMFLVVNGDPLKTFNPCVDPNTAEYSYSQRGDNRTMIFCHYVFDISAYVGGPVTLEFTFDTKDDRYNGFRGQFIDNVRVYAQ